MDLNAQNPGTAKAGDLQGTAASTVHDVLEGVQNAAGAAADKVKPVVAKLPQTVQAPLYQAVHAAAGTAASMSETPASVGGSIARYARAKPRQAVGIAFVTGFLIARIVF